MTLGALRVPAAERISRAVSLSSVAEEAALTALVGGFKDAHEGFRRTLGISEEVASLLTDRFNRIPHGVVHRIVVTFWALGEALSRLGDALEGRSHGRNSFSNAARRFRSTLFSSLEFSTVSVTEVDRRIPLAELVGKAGVLSVSVVTRLLASVRDGVPLTVRALFAARFRTRARRNITASRASTSTSVPLADTRVGRASSVGAGAVTSINAATRGRIPDAVGVSIASISGRVSGATLGAATATVPLTGRRFLALVRGEARARLSASTSDSVPSTSGVELTLSLSEVSVFTLLLALVGRSDPAAARLFSTGSSTSNSTTGLLASGLFSIPLTFNIISTRSNRRVLFRALDVTVVHVPCTHRFTNAGILNLVIGVSRHGVGSVDNTVATALARRRVPHAVAVAITSDGSRVLDTTGSEAASETRRSINEHAARVGNTVSSTILDGDGFTSVDTVTTNPRAVVVTTALIISLDLRTVS